MTFLLILFYTGGASFAFHSNRQVSGRFSSFFEALFWPWGLGYGVARVFYYDPDLIAKIKKKETGNG